MKKTNMQLLMKEVVDHFGGQYKLAAALNVSSVAVNAWMKREAFPPLRAIQLEKMTEGRFTANELVGGIK